MKKPMISASEERAMKEFEEQLARGEWDDDMTDEELDKWAEESARECDEFEKEILSSNPLHVTTREHESPYNIPKLRREDYNDD